MKNFILVLILLFIGCTSDSDFNKVKSQLEELGYTEIENTGYSILCCSEDDIFSTGFKAKDKDGNTIKGCVCSNILKGVTIRYR